MRIRINRSEIAKDCQVTNILVKGLIVMANNYYQLKDNFSATSILDSVIKNFKEFDDVIAEAQAQLKIIKGEAAKTNSSLTE